MVAAAGIYPAIQTCWVVWCRPVLL